MSKHQVAVIGAGPAGVSVALSLRDRGVHPLLLDRADGGASWRSRYDALTLNTGRPFSHLPGRPYPKGTPMFPTRDQVVAHLDQHAHEDGIELQLNTEVKRIDPGPKGWRLTTSAGGLDTRQVVFATGLEDSPVIPEWPGRDGFTGEILHSSGYRNPKPYQGKRAVVVGSGSSGMEIAYDLAVVHRNQGDSSGTTASTRLGVGGVDERAVVAEPDHDRAFVALELGGEPLQRRAPGQARRNTAERCGPGSRF